jgi:hypothetical protein
MVIMLTDCQIGFQISDSRWQIPPHPPFTRRTRKIKPQSTQRALKKIQRSQRTQWFVNSSFRLFRAFVFILGWGELRYVICYLNSM